MLSDACIGDDGLYTRPHEQHNREYNVDITEMSEQDFDAWLKQAEGGPSEGRLAEILSAAMRTDDKREKAQCLVDLANMAMVLADTALGAQSSVETSVHLRIH